MLLLILLVGASTAVAPPSVLHVDDVDDGEGGNFSTIQEAVDYAVSGDTVLVYPGTYTENVDVYRELTIQSVSGNPEDTVINPSGSDHAFDVSANNVTISGFKINFPMATYGKAAVSISSRNNTILNNVISITYTGSWYNTYGIYLTGSSARDNTILGNTITGNNYGNGNGIYFNYASPNNRILSNTISDFSCGAYLYYSGENELENNTISACNSHGLYLDNSDGNGLESNTISECNNYGLRLYNSEGNELKNNIMENNSYNFHAGEEELNNDIDTSNLVNGKPIYYLVNESDISADYFSNAGTIYLINCSGVTVRDQTLVNNYHGIFLFNTSNSTIENNNASSNEYGIYLENSNDNDLIGNYAFENDDEGINLEYSNSNTITGNNASLNDKGIRLGDSQFNTVSNNIANANDAPGIVLCYADNNTVSSNTVLDGDAKGINVYESNHNTLTGNTVNNSGTMGLHLYYSSYNTVVDNVITYSDCVGLKIEGCYNTLTGNNVSFNEGAGIVIYDDEAHNTTIENNVVNNNGCNGIRVKGSDNYVAGNTVCNNEDWGIFVGTCDGSSNNTVIENTVRNNLMGIVFRSLYDSEVTDNTVTDNGIMGIYLSESENLTLQDNTVNSNGYLEEEEDRVSSVVNSEEKEECNKRSEKPGIVEETGFSMASDLVLGASRSLEGAGIYLEYSSENCLISNTVENNSNAGLYFIGSWNNTIYNNEFNNTNNTIFGNESVFSETRIEEEGTNIWNITLTEGTNIMGGPYLGGNFWALPNGTGWSQTCNDTEEDWICDLPYNVTEDGENVDYFPLIDFPEPEPEPEPEPVRSSRKSGSPTYVPPPAGENAGPVDSSQKKVIAGQESNVQFPDPENGVLGVGFNSNGYSGMVIVRVEGADDENSGSDNKPKGKLYKQMKISVGNERFEENIDQGYIEFRVPKSWLEENGINPATVALNRYHGEAWNPLSTEITGEDEEFYYFRAETPGFSLYAITGEEKSSGAAEGTEVITPNEEETGTETGEEQTKPEESESAPGFESIFAALGILGSAFFVRKEILK